MDEMTALQLQHHYNHLVCKDGNIAATLFSVTCKILVIALASVAFLSSSGEAKYVCQGKCEDIPQGRAVRAATLPVLLLHRMKPGRHGFVMCLRCPENHAWHKIIIQIKWRFKFTALGWWNCKLQII